MSLFQPNLPDISGPQNLLKAAPELAKYAAETWLHAAEWSVGTWFHGASRLLKAAAEGNPGGAAQCRPG